MMRKNIATAAVGVFVFDQGNRLLLGKRIDREGYGDGEWQLPCGHIEPREGAADCASRELMEETSIGVDKSNFEFLGFANSTCHETQKCYVTLFYMVHIDGGENMPSVIRAVEESKCERWEWFDLHRLPNPIWTPVENYIKLQLKKGFGSGVVCIDGRN